MSKNLYIKKNKLILTSFNIIYLISLLIYFFQFKNYYYDAASVEKVLFPWIAISFVIHIINFKVRQYKLYDFGMWYILLSYVFLFGLLFREYFSLNYSLVWNPIMYFSNAELMKSYFFSLIALNCFSIGYFIIKKDSSDKLIDYDKVDEKKIQQMFLIGLILTVIGGICMVINDLKVINVMKTYNSYIGYKYAMESGILDDIAILFLPGLFLLFYSGKIKEKPAKYIFIFTIIYFVIVMMLTGSRKVKLFSIVSLFLGYNFIPKKHKKNKKYFLKLILYIFLAFLLFNVLFTIRDNRFELSNIIPIFFKNIKEMKFLKDMFGEIFSETGLTLLSIASIMRLVPSVFPYQYGLTFIKTIPSFLPIGWLIGDFFLGASSTNIINTYANLPLGSSLIGDLFWNFGMFGGFFASFIFGILVAALFNLINKNNDRIGMAIYFSIFSQLLMLVRAELFDIFRPLVIILIIDFILRKTCFPLRGGNNYEK